METTTMLLAAILLVLCVVVGVALRHSRSAAARHDALVARVQDAVAVLRDLKNIEAEESAQRAARIQALLTVRGTGREQLRERLARRLAEHDQP